MAQNTPPKTISSSGYLRVLEPFARASQSYEYVIPERPDLLCYGTGFNSWGVQTQQKAFAGLAVLATDPEFDQATAGMTREAVLDRALRMLRFSLESHHTGSYHCTDGSKWGHTWISALGIERMMHAVDAIYDYLSDDNKDKLRTLLISESLYQLDNRPIRAGTVENNVPESNAWNGALLLRTAEMYPDAPRVNELREKGIQLFMNSISIASDARCGDIVDGRPVSDWFVGDNFFSSYALNHHRYLNVGYMVITLSQIAMLHFFYRKLGRQAPQALYHHALDLWQLVKACTFPDGRLARIGGDTRVRYCYCQDYAIPVWLLAADKFDDLDVISFEKGWLETIQQELATNGDGKYLSGRCTDLSTASHGYYTRLESDRAAAISMGAYWRRIIPIASETVHPEPDYSVPFSWHDEYHGSCYHRSSHRIASWTWDAAEPPQGFCLPPDTSNLAESRENLSAAVLGEGAKHSQQIKTHKEILFDGGFLTWGSTGIISSGMLEGQPDENPLALQQIVYAALPDNATCLLMQFVKSPSRRTFVQHVNGLGLLVPNDIFNGCSREYFTISGKHNIKGAGSKEDIIETGSSWINADDKLGVCAVYGTDQIYIRRPGYRQIGLRSGVRRGPLQGGGMLYADELCGPYKPGVRGIDPETTHVDAAFVLQAGVNHKTTSETSTKCAVIDTGSCDSLRAISITGLDGEVYILTANFGDKNIETAIEAASGSKALDLSTGEKSVISNKSLNLTVPASSARLFRLIK